MAYDEQGFLKENVFWDVWEEVSKLPSHDKVLEAWMLSLETGNSKHQIPAASEFNLCMEKLYLYMELFAGGKQIYVDELLMYLYNTHIAPDGACVITECPVTVELYDQSGNLIASIESTDEILPTFEQGYCFLAGENNESKCFVLDSDDYIVNVIPYDKGTMTVLTESFNESGALESSYYENVVIEVGEVYCVDLKSKTMTCNGVEVEPTPAIPIRDIDLKYSCQMYSGETQKVEAALYPTTATVCDLIWSSSDDSIAMVSQDGLVTAISEGTVEITAISASGKSETALIHVETPAGALGMGISQILMTVSESYTVDLVAENFDFDVSDVDWSTTNPSVATVDEKGVITAISVGNCVITAAGGGAEAYLIVSVSNSSLGMSTSYRDTTKEVSIELYNHSCKETLDVTLVLAVYEECGHLIFVETHEVTMAPGIDQNLNLPLKLDKGSGKKLIKVFALDGSYVPMTACVDIANIT